MQYAYFKFFSSYEIYLFPLELQANYKKPKHTFAFITTPSKKVHDNKVYIGHCLYDPRSKYLRLGKVKFTFNNKEIIPDILPNDLRRFSTVLKIGMEEIIHDDWEMQPAEKLLTHQSDLIRSFVSDIIRKELQETGEADET